MSTQGNNEDPLQGNHQTAEEALLASLYHQQATKLPPAALDQKILDQAKEQLRLTTHDQPTRSRLVPYSVAVSLGLLGMLYLNFPQYYQLSQPPIIPDFEPVSMVEGSASDLELNEQPVALQKMKRAQRTMAPQQAKQAPASGSSILSQSQLLQLEQLLAVNKKQQAIELLQQLLQQQPNMILPAKYQKLLTQDPNNK